MSTGTHSNDDDRLMRYFDEELSSEEMELVQAELEGDEELAAKLEGLAHMRALLSETLEVVGADLDADAMFAAVEAKLADGEVEDDDPMFPAPVADEGDVEEGDEDAEDRPPLRVVPGGKRDSVPAEVVEEDPPSRTGVWIGVAGALAAAAVLFFIFRPPGNRGGTTDPGGEDPVAAAPAGSEVEDVDFGYSTGSIFTVEDPDAEAQYAVIWISDEEIDTDEGSPDDQETTDEDPLDADPEDPAPEDPAPEDPAPEEGDSAAPEGATPQVPSPEEEAP